MHVYVIHMLPIHSTITIYNVSFSDDINADVESRFILHQINNDTTLWRHGMYECGDQMN